MESIKYQNTMKIIAAERASGNITGFKKNNYRREYEFSNSPHFTTMHCI